MSEDRRIRRKFKMLERKGRLRTSDKEQLYADNAGELFRYKWLARLSSFLKVFNGCLHNGFPVAISHLWYEAWAMWPFFFVRKNLPGNPIPILNHERIHVRQQWDIHLTISLPIVVLCFIAELKGWFAPYPLAVIPFIPTILYGIAMVFSCKNLHDNGHTEATFADIRANTCFEREATSKQLNYDYLHTRKFWSVLAYTNIKAFQNYGIK